MGPLHPMGSRGSVGSNFSFPQHPESKPSLVPNFSTTIDAATGQTLSSAIPDLGDEFTKPSEYNAMRGYIALSRVTSADSLLVAQTFNPLLFRLGPQSFPSLLFKVLQGQVPLEELKDACQNAATESKRSQMLKDESWKCRYCSKQLDWQSYMRPKRDKTADQEWQKRVSKYIIQPGCLRACLSCREEHGETIEEDAASTFKCELCKLFKPRDKFPPGMYKHRDDPKRRTLCWTCAKPPCIAADCPTCKICRDPLCPTPNSQGECKGQMTALNSAQLPQTLEERDGYHCDACSTVCDVCEQTIPRSKVPHCRC